MNQLYLLLLLIFGSFFLLRINYIESIAASYEQTINLLGLLSLISILSTYFYQKKKSQENIEKNLSSISLIDIDSNATASIKNTSSVDGSILNVKIYKPLNIEKAIKNSNFTLFASNSQLSYEENFRRLTSSKDLTTWENTPRLECDLSIGEVTKLHLKNLEEESYFCHFAPIKIITTSPTGKVSTKIMLFRYAASGLRKTQIDPFIKEDLHPYDEWTLIYSKKLLTPT